MEFNQNYLFGVGIILLVIILILFMNKGNNKNKELFRKSRNQDHGSDCNDGRSCKSGICTGKKCIPKELGNECHKVYDECKHGFSCQKTSTSRADYGICLPKLADVNDTCINNRSCGENLHCDKNVKKCKIKSGFICINNNDCLSNNCEDTVRWKGKMIKRCA